MREQEQRKKAGFGRGVGEGRTTREAETSQRVAAYPRAHPGSQSGPKGYGGAGTTLEVEENQKVATGRRGDNSIRSMESRGFLNPPLPPRGQAIEWKGDVE